jgi:hypothetical protein
MTTFPAVFIPPQSPQLEPIALAVFRGVAECGGAATRPQVVLDATGAIEVSSDAPIAFVGWNGGVERSRHLASEILAALARQRPTPRPVALFETRVLEPAASIPQGVPASPRHCPGLHYLGVPERFVLRQGPRNGQSDLDELARARGWAAKVYRRWKLGFEDEPTPVLRSERVSNPSRWMGWCGAFE